MNIYDFIPDGAVEIANNPTLFIAPSMGERSTFTNYFLSQGHARISDDKAPTFQKEGKCIAGGPHPFGFLRKKRLDVLSRILNSSKMFTITLPWIQNRLHEVYCAPCEHCRSTS